jgi:hypothetical protein
MKAGTLSCLAVDAGSDAGTSAEAITWNNYALIPNSMALDSKNEIPGETDRNCVSFYDLALEVI